MLRKVADVRPQVQVDADARQTPLASPQTRAPPLLHYSSDFIY